MPLSEFFRHEYDKVMTSPDIHPLPDLLRILTVGDHVSWKWSVLGLQYRGEGNANLVVTTNGTYKVPRLPKSKFAEKYQLDKLIGSTKLHQYYFAA